MVSGVQRNIAAAVLILIAVFRVASTHGVFSETIDEAMHVACGLEWLQFGEYSIEPQHPPLARVAVAIGPWMRGAHIPQSATPQDAARAVFHSAGSYEGTLRAARMGVLPFFVAACILVWLWSTQLFGNVAGLMALILFTHAPPVLAHAGLATTDMAATAAFAGALWAFVSFVQNPARRSALLLGLAMGIALLTKFSLIPFLGISCGVALLIGVVGFRQRLPGRGAWTLCFAVAAITVWAGYRFSVGSFSTPDMRYGKWVNGIVGESGMLHSIAFGVLDSGVLPAPEFMRGVDEVGAHNMRGHRSFLLGDVRTDGWWYFFPVALGVKTPLLLLLCGMAGLVWFAWQWRADWRRTVIVLAFVLPMLFSMTARINIGVRHVLPLFPLLSMAAAALCVRTWTMGSRWKWVAVVTVALTVVPAAFEHPDYLAYFNVVAGRHPEEILVDSDLDWGQDVLRLRDTLRRMGIGNLGVVDLGSADLQKLGFPQTYFVKPNTRPEGYMAISWYSIKARPAEYGWLDKEMPSEWVGRSILLYRF